MKRFIVPAILIVGAVGLRLLSVWSTFDGLLTKLRSTGSAGKFMADILVSPITFIVLVVVAIGLIWKGIQEARTARLPRDNSEVAKKQSVKQTMINSPGGTQAGRDVRPFSGVNDDEEV